jgi:predicted TIM-barrel fold metal-dependent hydrolase
MKKLIIALVGAGFLLNTNSVSGQKRPIIDMHVHAYGANLSAPTPCYVPCENPPAAAQTDEELLGTTLAAMEEHNIVLAYLIGTPEMHERWSKAASDRFFRSMAVRGDTPQPSVKVIREAFDAGVIQGIGEISTKYAGISPNDPKLEPYFALAEELDLPVLIHTLGIGAFNPGFRSAAGRPLLLEEVLAKHRNLRLSVEDAGWPFGDEMIALMYMYPNVYADLSTISWIIPRQEFHAYLEKLIRAELGKRLMFGSDAVYWPEAIHRSVESIETASFLTEEQKRDIFYNNAARFLRLSDEEIAEHRGK